MTITPNPQSVRAGRNSLVRETFVRTADEDYITARWCAQTETDYTFLWLALHCLEKYLKAALLLNGQPAFGGHDIVALYTKLAPIAGSLLPLDLPKPPKLNVESWRTLTAAQFIERLERNGNADNRYAVFGYVTSPEDLHMLDQMVFAIRRLACALDEPYFDRPNHPQITYRQTLEQAPSYRPNYFLPLDKLISAEPSDRRHAALNLNFLFAPTDYEHTPIRSRFAASNPVLVRRILDPLESDQAAYAAEGAALGEWMLASTKLPPGVRDQISKAIAKAKTKHGLP